VSHEFLAVDDLQGLLAAHEHADSHPRRVFKSLMRQTLAAADSSA
jgi:hypothetical protein